MTDLDHFEDNKRYMMSGETLNKISDAITERTPIAGWGLLSTELPHGVMFRLDPSVVGPKKSSSGSSSSGGSSSSSSSGSSGSSSSSGSSGSSGSPAVPSQPVSSPSSQSSGSSESSGSSPSSGSSGPGSSGPGSSGPGSSGPGSSGPGSSGPGSSGPGSSGPGSSGPGSPGSPGSNKSAIVPVVMPDGTTEYVGWLCVESDRVVFEIVRDVVLGLGAGKRDKGRLQLEHEMIASCEPGSLRVVSAMPVGCCAMVCASVAMGVGKKGPVATVEAMANVPAGMALPKAVRVRMEGVRLGHPEQWPRFTEEQYISNNEFWGAAREIGIA